MWIIVPLAILFQTLKCPVNITFEIVSWTKFNKKYKAYNFFLGSWTVAATKLLIALRSTYNEKFQNAKKKREKNGTVVTNF